MVTNKSIDGLSTRAAKASALKSTTPRPTPVKAHPTKPAKSTKRRTTIDSMSKPTRRSLDGTVHRSTKPTKKSVTPKLSEEFINAPTTDMWDSIKLDDTADDPFTDSLESSLGSHTEESIRVPVKDQIEDDPDTLNPSEFLNDDEPIKKPVKKSKKKPAVTTTDEDAVADFLKPVQAFDFDEDSGLTESEDTVDSLKSLSQSSSEDEEEDEEPKMSKKDKKLAKKLKKAEKKPSKKRRIISIVALVVVLLLIGGVVWMVLWGNDIIAKLTGGRGNVLDLLSLNSETYDPLKTDSNGRTNVLAFGTGGYDMSGEEGGGIHDGAQLTDSIMLISFNQNTGDTAMISLPRDLKGPATCTSTGKINEVYWCNGGDGDATTEQEEVAATALMEAVGGILGVDIQYYAHLNWGSIVSIVDTLGGITVTLDEDILDYEYTGAVYYANTPYTINGAEAVGLARARHGTMGGDFSRGASQQKIIVGIKNRIFEKDLSIPDMLGLVTTLGDNLRTNFSLTEFKTLAHDVSTLDLDVMRQISLYPDYMTTGNINGISYVLPSAGIGNYTAIQRFVSKQLSSDPRDYEEPTIAIYNATDTVGLASEEKLKLEAKGYTVTTIDNAPAGDYPSGISIYATTSEKPGTFRLLEDDYHFTPLSTSDLPATIAPSYDFIIIINTQGN